MRKSHYYVLTGILPVHTQTVSVEKVETTADEDVINNSVALTDGASITTSSMTTGIAQSASPDATSQAQGGGSSTQATTQELLGKYGKITVFINQ